MFIARSLSDRLKHLFEVFPIVVVVGARQVGKTTLLKHLFGKEAEIVTFDPIIDVENARVEPDLFLENHSRPIILDEIQYAPELLSALKKCVDKNPRPGQFLLTGSEQWSVIKNMSESLAGRAILLNLDSLSLTEIGKRDAKQSWLARWLKDPKKFKFTGRMPLKYPLYEQLWRGFLPKAQSIPLDTIYDFHASYLQTYLERDVRSQADISNLSLFRRFIQLASALTAQEISYSQLGREIGISPQTSQRWLQTLKAAFQWFEIDAFSNNALKKLSQKPKGYFVDTGLICHLQGISSPSVIPGSPLFGPLFESAVVSEIRKDCSLQSFPPRLAHFRAYSGAEVDLILEKDGRYFPIEIKANSHPKKSDARGLNAFRENNSHLKIEPGLILCPAQEAYSLTKDVYVLPWDSI